MEGHRGRTSSARLPERNIGILCFLQTISYVSTSLRQDGYSKPETTVQGGASTSVSTKPLDVFNANVRAIFSHVCGENTGYFEGDAATKTDIFDSHVGTNNTGSLSSCVCGNNTEYLEKDIAMYFQAGLWQQ